MSKRRTTAGGRVARKGAEAKSLGGNLNLAAQRRSEPRQGIRRRTGSKSLPKSEGGYGAPGR